MANAERRGEARSDKRWKTVITEKDAEIAELAALVKQLRSEAQSN